MGEVQTITKTITTRNWSRWRGRHAFHFTNEEYPTGDYLLEVLTLDTARQVIDKIPTGSIIIVVRKTDITTPFGSRIWVLLYENSTGYNIYKIRHATSWVIL